MLSFKIEVFKLKIFLFHFEKHNFFVMNIEYIYEKISNSTLKK